MADASNSYFKKGSPSGILLDFYHVPSGTRVSFKAFLVQFDDSYQSKYNEESVYGRMDPFQIFQGTQRSISLAWQIPAYSPGEAKSNLRKCSLLVSMLYPSYEKTRGNAAAIKGTPIIKIKFANLITDTSTGNSGGTAADSGLAGAMSSVQVVPNMEPGFVITEEHGNNMMYPKLIDLSCKFAVIHQHSLGWQGRGARPGFKNFPYNIPNKVAAATSAPTKPTVEEVKDKETEALTAMAGHSDPYAGTVGGRSGARTMSVARHPNTEVVPGQASLVASLPAEEKKEDKVASYPNRKKKSRKKARQKANAAAEYAAVEAALGFFDQAPGAHAGPGGTDLRGLGVYD